MSHILFKYALQKNTNIYFVTHKFSPLLERYGWQQNSSAFTESHTNLTAARMSTNNHFITVLQELASFAAI